MNRLLYGTKNALAADVAGALSQLLESPLQQRESDYFGIYWVSRSSGIDVKVVSQPDPEGESFEDDFADYATLVYVGYSDIEPNFAGLGVGEDVLCFLRRG